jgi:hypothetical protein
MAKKNREPGQLAQLWKFYKVTRKHNPLVTLWTLLVFVGPIALAVVGSLIFSAGNVINWIIWVVLGVLVGILLALITMGRIAESTARSTAAAAPVHRLSRRSSRNSAASIRGSGAAESISSAPQARDVVGKAVMAGNARYPASPC